jgi:hypothetical protein
MLRRSLRALLMAVLVCVPFALGAPQAGAECTDLNGQGHVCTAGDPATGTFGIDIGVGHTVHLCITVQAACPYPVSPA